MTSTADNKSIVLRLYSEALNEARYDEVVDELVAADAVTHDGLERGTTGREAVRSTMRALHQAFTDLQFTIDGILAEHDRVAAWWHMTGTHTGTFAGQPATGRRVTQRAVVLYRLAGGQVIEVWPLVDRLGLQQQLRTARPARAAPAGSPTQTESGTEQ